MQLSDSTVFIRNLRMKAFHGVLEQERTVGNDYVVDVALHYNILRARDTDDIRDTANYAQMAEVICDVMKKPSNLLENVAERMAESLFGMWPEAKAADICIMKVCPPMSFQCDGAGVRATFTNETKEE